MSKIKGLKFALAALVCIAAFVMLLHVTAQPAAAAPLPGEIFIDVDGDRTFNASVDEGLFPTIQDAIDNATSGDVIVVGSGTYAENLVIPVDVRLFGANEGIDPNTGIRVNETRLIPNTASIGPLVLLGSSDIVIDGFSINGSNPLLGSLGSINGINLTMAWGIANLGGENNITFTNNIFETFDTALTLSGLSINTTIMNNEFDNIEPIVGGGFAVELISDFSANVTNNVFTRTSTAIFASTFTGAFVGPISSYVFIDSNSMAVTFDGIVLDRMSGLTSFAASNNAIEATGIADAGIVMQGVENTNGASLSFNAISGMTYGIMLTDNPSSANLAVIGGLIINCNFGIYAQEGAIAVATGDSVYTVDSVMIVNPTAYAVYINNTNSLGSSLTGVNFQNGSIILGGLNGIGVVGIGAMASFSGPEPINMIGVTDQYIRLIGSPRNIDATQVLFDGNIGVDLALAQNFAIEDKVFHALDQSGLGLVTWVTDQIFVTQSSGSIQRAIDVASTGTFIDVQAGTYAEALTISKAVNLRGPNAGFDPNNMVREAEANIIPDSVGVGPLIMLAANGVTIDGFSINGSNPALGRLGVINGVNLTMAFGVQNFGGENNFIFVNNVVSTFDTAIQLYGLSHGGLIAQNLFDNIDQALFNGFAVNLVSDYFSDIRDNSFARTHTGIYITNCSVGGSVSIDGNVMSVHWDGIVLDRLSGTEVWTVSNNVIVAAGSNTGITVEGVQGAVSVNLIGNAIDSMQYGIMLIDNPATAGVSISAGLLINCVYGLYAHEGSFATVDGDSRYLLDGTEFVNPSAYAIYIYDPDSISVSTTNVTVQNGTIVLGGLNGIGVEGTGAIVFFNGAEPINFIGVSSFYFRLIDSPRNIDARQVLFEGLTGVQMSNSTLAATEEKIIDKLDNRSLGRVFIANVIIIVPPGDSIQAAIDAAAPGDFVVVLAGNYSESLNIWKPLSLLGPNAGIDPSTGVRVPEACIVPPTVSNGPLITISSSGVIVDGFCINGSNPLLGRLGVINGVNLTMAWGIANLDGEDNVTIANNEISTFDTAIMLTGESRDNLIGNNLFDNIDDVIGGGLAIHLSSDFFANVTTNVFTRTHTALFAGAFNAPGSVVIDGNTMTVVWDGIVLERINGSSTWSVSNNVIVAAGTNSGITVQGVQGSASVALTGNAIDSMQYGIMLIDNPTTAGVLLSSDLMINCVYGVYAQEGSFAIVDGDSQYLLDAMEFIDSGAYAIYVNDTDSISLSTTIVTIQNGTIVLGGSNGIGVEGTGAVLAFNGADPLELTGVVNYYIRLINSPRDIDARQVLFEGLTGADMTPTQVQGVEEKILDKVDDPALGVVMIVSAQVTATKLNDLTGDGETVGDTPIQGWTVYLWKDGVRGAPQLTGADGTFTWTELGPGIYNVSEDIPANWTATSSIEHSFGTAMSGGIYSFSFTNFHNVDITVTKLKDLTGDGKTADDTPIEGWTVYLWTNGTQGSPELTGEDGTFTWTNLGPGSYNVSELVPAGWNATSPTYNDFGTVVSGETYNFTFTNFQTFQYATITVTKLNDLTGNGQTADDIPIQGWIVYLWTDGAQGSPELTGADGKFTWDNLGPGSYMVSELVPLGWTATSETQNDFGAATSGGVYSFNFTNFQNVSITATKLNDLTGNGQTPDDIPIQGWTVYLWTNGVRGSAQLTGIDGTFTWSDLGPGSYNVSELVTAGWRATGATNHAFGPAMSGGVYSFNFTNFQEVSITVTKLNDLTGNGQTPDDTPIQGWTVYLWTNGVRGSAQLTGIDGTYTWADLGPGSYNVSELVPLGWNATSPTFIDFGTVVSGETYNFTFTNLKVDLTPPSISIVSPLEGALIGTANVMVTWTGSDTLSGIEGYNVSIDGSAWLSVGMSTNHMFVGLSNGSHNVTVRANDNAGNNATKSVHFTVQLDVIAPTMTPVTPAVNKNGVLRSTVIVVSFSEEMLSATVALSPSVTAGSYSWNAAKTQLTYTPGANLAYGTIYTVSIVGTDLAGNALTGATSWTFTTIAHLTGVVKDPKGNPIANATVNITGAGFADEVKTGPDGSFGIDVPVGVYNLTISASGMKDLKKEVVVTVGANDLGVQTMSALDDWTWLIIVAIVVIVAIAVLFFLMRRRSG